MKLYLTKHSNGIRQDITDLAVSWSWSGDKASLSRQLEVEIAFWKEAICRYRRSGMW